MPCCDFSFFRRLESAIEEAEQAVQPHIMNEQEIMHKYYFYCCCYYYHTQVLLSFLSSLLSLSCTSKVLKDNLQIPEDQHKYYYFIMIIIIIFRYWKISMNVRLASVALQRWMSRFGTRSSMEYLKHEI